MNLARYFSPRRFWIPAICALALAGCGHSAKNDPVAAMNDFFTLMAKQHFQGAFESASMPFQEQFNAVAFEALCRDFSLGDFVSCTWTPESNTGKEAVLTGVFMAKNNQPLPLRATLIRESGKWKLFLLEAATQQQPTKFFDVFGRFKYGVGYNEAFTRKIPNDDEIRKLVTETMEKFNESLHQKNFQAFYDYASTLWQARNTEAQVEAAFKPYVAAGQTLDFITGVKMIFTDPPRLNSEGNLAINGYYPTQPRVVFHLQYMFELPKWKVVGISLSVQP